MKDSSSRLAIPANPGMRNGYRDEVNVKSRSKSLWNGRSLLEAIASAACGRRRVVSYRSGSA